MLGAYGFCVCVCVRGHYQSRSTYSPRPIDWPVGGERLSRLCIWLMHAHSFCCCCCWTGAELRSNSVVVVWCNCAGPMECGVDAPMDCGMLREGEMVAVVERGGH